MVFSSKEKKKLIPVLRKGKKIKNEHENFNRKDIREKFLRKRELAFNTLKW